MSTKTGIEWTEATWNPIVGCTHVSPGCDHCYAARDASGRLQHVEVYKGLASAGRFTGEVRLLRDRLRQPLAWKRPRHVFVNSMSDLFHASVPDGFIAEVFGVMAASRHTFQVLTKRHSRARALLRSPHFRELVDYWAATAAGNGQFDTEATGWPLPNVWLGVSVETQKWADIRIPALIETPAAVRFLSCEPLLGPINFAHRSPHSYLDEINWVIAGGESGPRARPMHPDWVRGIRDQCTHLGVPFLFKQWGEYGPANSTDDPDRVIRLGKKAAGRELDGQIWDEYPHLADGDVDEEACRVCGCTDDDCSACIAATGTPCWWAEPGLCSRCADVTSPPSVITLPDLAHYAGGAS